MPSKLKDTIVKMHKLSKRIIILLVEFLEYLKSVITLDQYQNTLSYDITLKIKHIRIKKAMLGIVK